MNFLYIHWLLQNGRLAEVQCHALVKKNKELPKAVILEAPFSTLTDIASHVYPPLSSLVVYNFNNLHNVKSMNKSLPIYVLHSKADETIPYDHALKIKNETGCDMIEISGKHCEPIYNSATKSIRKPIRCTSLGL